MRPITSAARCSELQFSSGGRAEVLGSGQRAGGHTKAGLHFKQEYFMEKGKVYPVLSAGGAWQQEEERGRDLGLRNMDRASYQHF